MISHAENLKTINDRNINRLNRQPPVNIQSPGNIQDSYRRNYRGDDRDWVKDLT